MKPAERLSLGGHVLVNPSEFCGESHEDDKFQMLSVVKVTRLCEDYVYGYDKNGSEKKVPVNQVFEIPQDWPWILAAPNSMRACEPKMVDCDQGVVKQELFDPLMYQQADPPAHDVPRHVESIKMESNDISMTSDNEDCTKLQSCDLVHGSPNGNCLSQSHDMNPNFDNGSDVTLIKEECLFDFQ